MIAVTPILSYILSRKHNDLTFFDIFIQFWWQNSISTKYKYLAELEQSGDKMAFSDLFSSLGQQRSGTKNPINLHNKSMVR